MYMTNAMRETFSDIGFAPNTMAAIAYQMAICADTFICCDEWPKPHQIRRYANASISAIKPRLHNSVGTRMIAPLTMVKTAITAAVIPPKVTSDTDPS